MSLRLSESQRVILKAKAEAAGIPINRYILASALGSDYRPPHDPEWTKALLAANRELTRQGTNLNQIAHRRNAGLITDAQANSMLDILGRSLLRTHKAVRNALSRGTEPEP